MQNIITHPERRGLSSAYVTATFKLPDELRARLPLDEKAIGKLSGGRNLVIRGFWRIGKTELMRGAIGGACERLCKNGIFFDLRSDKHEDGVPKTEAEVLEKIALHLGTFYAACNADVKIDLANPFRSLEKVQSEFFIGIDEMIALHGLGEESMGRIIGMMKALPDNIRLALVCHRNRTVDGIFDREFGSDDRFDTIFIPTITDDEVERLVVTPASSLGYSFSPGAISALAKKSGNKPWELFTYAYMAADAMERLGVEEADGDLVEEAVSVGTAKNDDFGSLVIENYARIYLLAMDAGEKETMKRIALGTFDEKTADNASLNSLLQTGWIKQDGIWEIQSTMFQDFIKAVETGEFSVTVVKG
jgi:hypothetical protein